MTIFLRSIIPLCLLEYKGTIIYRVSKKECARHREGVPYVKLLYTGCNRRNGPDFGRVFLMLNYTEKPQNTYIQC